MRITVFGAAGRVGRHVAAQALLRAHDVTAFIRDRGGLDVAVLAGGAIADDPLRAHIEEIGRLPPLLPAQEDALVRRMELSRLAAELRASIEADDAVDREAVQRAIARLSEMRDPDGRQPVEVDEAFRSLVELDSRSPADLVGFLHRLETDGRLARQQLLDANLRLVVSIARRHEGRGESLLGLVAAGSLGLVRAIAGFESSRGDRFSTHAGWHVRQAIARVLAERAAGIEPARASTELEVVVGDARDGEPVERAVVGRDAVVSALALPAGEQEFEHSEATRAIVGAATRAGVRRVIVTACADVLSDRELTGDRAPFAREDERIRDELRSSRLDWTIGAATWITDDPPTGRYEAVVDDKARGGPLAAADFATFVLDALERDDWIGHIVGVSGVLSTPERPSAERGGPRSAG